MAWDFGGITSRYNNFKATFPKKVADEVIRQFKESFDKKAFSGTNANWKPRKSARGSHPLLQKSGDLKNSIKATQTSFRQIVIESALDYSRIHNRGGETWNGGVMPKRQYMGGSAKLRARIERMIQDEFQKIFRG